MLFITFFSKQGLFNQGFKNFLVKSVLLYSGKYYLYYVGKTITNQNFKIVSEYVEYDTRGMDFEDSELTCIYIINVSLKRWAKQQGWNYGQAKFFGYYRLPMAN